ncbi:MAG: DNA repair protein RadC [SAR324 cluster bacterium]|nr:DNA repair protein RadC [SAR324 cluster bacterium]
MKNNQPKAAIKDWPEGERPREKLIQFGPEVLSDVELLAILLRVGSVGQSAKDLGMMLLRNFNDLFGIDRAHVEDLMEIKGLGIAKAAQLKAAIEIGKRVRRQQAQPLSFSTAESVAEYCYPKYEGKRYELFLALLLDGQNHLLAERIIAEGVPTQATIYTRRVMEEALRVSASSIVLVHNHPSGEVNPSDQDVETTQKLKQAADVLELVLLDHIIIGSGNFYSFSDNNNILI